MDADAAAKASANAAAPDDAPGVSIDALRKLLESTLGRPVALVETHISWVLLDGEHAWKIKKPVTLGFLDFARLETRRSCCEEELRLNRRLAPEIYLDVVAIRGARDAPRLEDLRAPVADAPRVEDADATIIGVPPPDRADAPILADRADAPILADRADASILEYAVRMRQFAAGSLFSEKLAAGTLDAGAVERFAQRFAAFQREAPAADETMPWGSAERVRADTALALDGIAAAARSSSAWVAAMRERFEAKAQRLRPAFEARKRGGWIREGHGDLHLANVVVLDTQVTAFDCIEFDPGLRWIDVQNDAAFLAMDLLAHDRTDLAFRFLDAWLGALGDYEGLAVLRYYLAYRAVVRELVASIRGAQGAQPPTGPRYAGLASQLLASRDPRLLITHGVSGSGKSFAASRLLERSGAIRIRSDLERKRLHGLDALARSHSGLDEGLYGGDASARTYARLLDLAALSLDAGWPTIVDATFLRAADRERFRALAAQHGAPFSILDCAADERVLRERVEARLASGADPSEADLRVLERQLAQREPLRDEERACAIVVDTSREPLDVDAIARAWRRAAAAFAAR